MFCGKYDLLLRTILTSAIAICSVLGDQGLRYGKSALIRALFDNLTHAIVGGLTWTLILILSKQALSQNWSSIVLCFCVSSFIDVDHFVAARSWNINDATHLEKRPFLHCTTVPIIIWLVLNSNVCNCPKLSYCSWIILAGFLSHHIRDGTRRGLWFYPLGSTQPIPYYLYLALCMMLPYVLQSLMTLYLKVPKVDDRAAIVNIV